MSLDSTWFSEPHDLSGSAISFRIKRKLAEEQTPFQKIEIFETTDWGNLMVIDGCVMLTTRDNFLYHEMMSHPVLFTPPAGLTIETPTQTEIVIKGADKQVVGQAAAKIRAFRPPEPYKGKGVRYAGEKITLKEAKKA